MKTLTLRSSILRSAFFFVQNFFKIFIFFSKFFLISYENPNSEVEQNGFGSHTAMQTHAGIMSSSEQNEYRQNGYHGNGSSRHSSNGHRSYQKNNSYNSHEPNGTLGISVNEWGRPLEPDQDLEK